MTLLLTQLPDAQCTHISSRISRNQYYQGLRSENPRCCPCQPTHTSDLGYPEEDLCQR